jgi:hypothetical protein
MVKKYGEYCVLQYDSKYIFKNAFVFEQALSSFSSLALLVHSLTTDNLIDLSTASIKLYQDYYLVHDPQYLTKSS